MQYPSTADLFLPLAPNAQQSENRVAHDYLVLGRLRPGVTVGQAQSEMRVIADRLATSFPSSNLGWSTKVEPLLEGINGDLTPLYFRLMLAASAFVLLVVCANVANLQFVRSLSRQPEIAVRTALGAARSRLLGHLLVENVVLGLFGAIGGLVLAAITLHICAISMPDRVARYVAGWSNISLNGHALVFSLILAVGAGLISGLFPALKALHLNLVDQLKAGSRTTSGSRQTHRLRDTFAICQISLSVMLVIGAALMCKGMWALLHIADVYQPRQTLTFNVTLPPGRYSSDEKMAAWYQSSLERLRALPGVTHAEITTSLPNGQDGWSENVRIEDRPTLPGKFQSAVHLVVSAGYLEALHIPLVSGRTFNSNDSTSTQPVVMISNSFASRYFPGENPIGRRIQMGSDAENRGRWLRIVGVTSDVNYNWIDRGDVPAVYLDVAQIPPSGATYILTTTGDPLLLTPSVHAALSAIDSRIPLDAIQTYQQYLNESLTGLIYVAVMLTLDAGVGLLLAAIGIFGVMANIVAERSREIALRMVLGANPQDMMRMILRRAAILTAAGVVTGIGLAAGLARLSASLLFGVNPSDPIVFLSITGAVTTIALLVSWGPARRAASIDPMRAIRAE
jgi:putative ABC transport system permease protein